MTNPLFHPSDLPFGVPDFAAITVADIAEALTEGMRQESQQWETIAADPQAPSVINTVVAVDASGAVLGRAESVFYTLLSSLGGTELNELYEQLAPRFSAHSDQFWMNEALYRRFAAVAKLEDLDPETAWHVAGMVADFERSGVSLDEGDKETLRALNAKIASLQAQIDTRITKQLDQTFTTGTAVEELAGLPAERVQAAALAAEDSEVAWKLPVMNFSQPPLIASLADHETRGRALADSMRRGFGGDPDLDTRSLIVELAAARAQRAQLLGFPDHAALAMDDQTVPGPKEALNLLASVGRSAVARMDGEKGEYEALAQESGFDLGPEDWLYFEDKKRAGVLGIDSDELSKYFVLDSVVNDGLFFAANRLYGLTFRPRADIHGWCEDVRTWEVFDEDERPLGLFMADFYTRPGKNGGAWMSELQAGSARTGLLPIVTNDANFDKPEDGGPTLLTWDGVETCFHEFGHALHGLLSNTYYEATAGTEVPSDFVELPSQLNEMWAYNPVVLGNFAKHYETGESLPADIVSKLSASKHFGQAHATAEYVQAALIDQYWHRSPELLPTDPEAVEAFESASLGDAGVSHDLVVPRYRTPYFAHTFAGGYDGAYYSYMWAEAMVGELEEWFAEQSQVDEDGNPDGGLNRRAGKKLRVELLSRGDSRDPLESFVAVRGHMPDGAAVTRRRGLV